MVDESKRPEPQRPDAAFLSNDIDRAVDYRKEYYKYIISISSALLAFTVSFPPNLASPPQSPEFIIVAWAGLGLAIISGVSVHYLWAQFFITWRDHDNRRDFDGGKRVRAKITLARRICDFAQILGLVIGLFGVVLFAATNLGNIAPKQSEHAPEAPEARAERAAQ